MWKQQSRNTGRIAIVWEYDAYYYYMNTDDETNNEQEGSSSFNINI